MALNVYKFGGASVKDTAGFLNVVDIINNTNQSKLIVIVSAIGKTTNALEKVVEAYCNGGTDTKSLLDQVKKDHLYIIDQLGLIDTEVVDDINDAFVEVDWILEDEVHDPFDYLYDQIVSIGEVLSSRILFAVLKSNGFPVSFLDIRDVLITDEVHREAKVKWDIALPRIKNKIDELFNSSDIIVSQGFIGATSENNTTTLGREGSDYTAAIMSYCCDAEAMHIWKDVPGVLTGDPNVFDNVTKIDRLSYNEAIEMTYYGAKVIHPKTIKPLQNKGIPMFVRPFNDVQQIGTRIGEYGESTYPPIIVMEPHQTLLHISVKDFSFVAEHHISNIFKMIADLRIKVNMMKNTAISFTICVQHNEDKIQQFQTLLGHEFTLLMDKDLDLITIRHYTEDILMEMKKGRLTLFEERLKDTVQIVLKEIPLVVRK